MVSKYMKSSDQFWCMPQKHGHWREGGKINLNHQDENIEAYQEYDKISIVVTDRMIEGRETSEIMIKTAKQILFEKYLLREDKTKNGNYAKYIYPYHHPAFSAILIPLYHKLCNKYLFRPY